MFVYAQSIHARKGCCQWYLFDPNIFPEVCFIPFKLKFLALHLNYRKLYFLRKLKFINTFINIEKDFVMHQQNLLMSNRIKIQKKSSKWKSPPSGVRTGFRILTGSISFRKTWLDRFNFFFLNKIILVLNKYHLNLGIGIFSYIYNV